MSVLNKSCFTPEHHTLYNQSYENKQPNITAFQHLYLFLSILSFV